MTFRALPLLWLLAVMPLALLFLLARESHRLRLGRRFIAERLRGVANPARVLRPYLITLALAAALIALAGPSRGFRSVPVEARNSNRVLAIDVSKSMDARDAGTSRLDAAKAIAHRLIDAHEGRIALVAFEDGAEVVSPLTTDDDAVAEMVDSLSAGELGTPGTDLGSAVAVSQKLLESDPGQKGDIVLLSDGEDQLGRTSDAVKAAKEKGVAVHTITIGSTAGERIYDERGNAMQQESGADVVTVANPEAMAAIARETGGEAYVNPFGAHALDSLATPRNATSQTKMIQVPIDRYQWPLALAFVAFACGSLANRGAE